MAKRTDMDAFINLLDALGYCSCLGWQLGSTCPATGLYTLVADIEEPAWTTLVCLGRRLELDVPIQEPMYSLNQALDFPRSLGVERL